MIPDRLPDGGWRLSAPVRAVVAALGQGGGRARFVGGCVRDALLGIEPQDIDIATTDRPERVMQLAKAAGLAVVPTGLAHGTVTVIADHCPVEVTTLRHDLETDGRHATVAFTDDWAADAARRDFTINAIYADPDGTLFDPVGGRADLSDGRVRFIGEARDRLAEDYLRGLRFFRFHARFAQGPADAAALEAISALRDGLRRLSAERVSGELLKILGLPRAPEAMALMQGAGVLDVILPEAGAPGLTRLAMAHDAGAGDGLLLLAALLPDQPAVAHAVAKRLRLSRAEEARLAAALDPVDLAGERKALVYRRGRQAVQDRLVLTGRAAEMPALAALEVPAFPIKGADLVALGAPKGPVIGKALAAVEAWWLAAGLTPDRTACLAEARRHLHP